MHRAATERIRVERAGGPAGLPLVALVRIAGACWRVEEAFRAGKGLCGLDQHLFAAPVADTGHWLR